MKALVQEIASLVGATVIGEASRVIDSFAGIEDASKGALSFLSNEKYVAFLDTTAASAVLISRSLVPNHSVSPTLIVVEDAYASTRRSDSDFRPSVPSTIEAPARHISMTSEKIEMPPLGGEAPDESAASDAENGKNAETPAEETPAQDAPAGDGAETPDHE